MAGRRLQRVQVERSRAARDAVRKHGRGRLATITITVNTGSDPQVTWAGKKVGCASTSAGVYTCSLQNIGAGTYVYAIVVWGSPGEAWSATVKGGQREFDHSGHMSPAGY